MRQVYRAPPAFFYNPQRRPSVPRRRYTMRTLHPVILALALALAAGVPDGPAGLDAQAQGASFSPEDVFSYPFPADLTAASKAGRIAWTFNEQGRRNIFVAEAPDFDARRLTAYDADDGQELSSVALSASGD